MTRPAQMKACQAITETLVALAVGERVVFKDWHKHLSTYRKWKARLAAGDPNAKWQSRLLTRGVRVTRIS